METNERTFQISGSAKCVHKIDGYERKEVLPSDAKKFTPLSPGKKHSLPVFVWKSWTKKAKTFQCHENNNVKGILH